MSDGDAPLVELRFEIDVLHWRGPSPYFFAPLPPEAAAEVQRVARSVTYGWGMIPVAARMGDVVFKTSLFPKDDGYLLPLKDVVRRQANVTAGDRVAIEMTVHFSRR